MTTAVRKRTASRIPGRKRLSSVMDGFAQYPVVPRQVVYLFGIYVFSWYLQIGMRREILGAIRFEFCTAATLGAIWAYTAFSGKGEKGIYPLYTYVAIYYFLVIIQVPLSIDPQRSQLVFTDRVLQFSVLGLFIATYVKSPADLRIFMMFLMVAWLKMGQEGFWGKWTGSLVWENQGVQRLHGSTRLFAHPNSFSGFGLGTVPFVYYLYPVVVKYYNKYFKWALMLMMVFAVNIILFTGSRTGYVGFGVFVFWVIWHSKQRAKAFGTVAVIGILSIPFIPADYIHRATSIFTGEEKEGDSSGQRMEIIRDAIQIFIDNPFGVGVNGFPVIRRHVFDRFQDTHNLYLEAATNLGIQGLIAFMLMVMAMLRLLRETESDLQGQVRTMSERAPPPEKKTPKTKRLGSGGAPDEMQEAEASHLKDLELLTAVTSAVRAFIVVRLTLGLFGHDLYEIYWWFALGLTVSMFRMNVVALERTRWFENRATEGEPEPAPATP